jgi:acetoin utilization deacetylase AcuC-like enzyme
MGKYGYVPQLLLERGVLAPRDLVAPGPIAREDLLRVHTPAYLAKLEAGTLTPAEERQLGVPWSVALWRRSQLAAQGTLDAARRALADGLSANLAGGTHHAFPDHGEGYCVLNDVAIAIRALQAEGSLHRVLVVDLDVHQGNGTAAIFRGDERVYTFSMHGARNYPVRKQRSTLDVELPDGTGDESYLAALDAALPRAIEESRAGLVFYLAGVDVLAGDRYGRLALSEAGLRARERRVLGAVRAAGLPIVITLAGGYAPTPLRTAELHAIVFEEAAAYA